MNFWERLKLKIIADNWEEYGYLKYSRLAKEQIADYKPWDFSPLTDADRATITFKHSGNSGDIIYALPFVRQFVLQKKANLFLHLDQKAGYDSNINHPLGPVMLNKKMAQMLTPLLLAQDYINECCSFEGQKIDIDLDQVRNAPIPFSKVSLSRWYFLVFGLNADLSQPWLKVNPDDYLNESILIARSNRYRGHRIDYQFLRRYPNIHFVGVEQEFKDMKAHIPHIQFRPVKNFLEMASLIAGAKLFIGNQSFPFSVAEGLKANRLLEVSANCPDVSVNGENGHEFYFQEHFESLVKRLYK
jgi:hypothetical protein